MTTNDKLNAELQKVLRELREIKELLGQIKDEDEEPAPLKEATG